MLDYGWEISDQEVLEGNFWVKAGAATVEAWHGWESQYGHIFTRRYDYFEASGLCWCIYLGSSE